MIYQKKYYDQPAVRKDYISLKITKCQQGTRVKPLVIPTQIRTKKHKTKEDVIVY